MGKLCQLLQSPPDTETDAYRILSSGKLGIQGVNVDVYNGHGLVQSVGNEFPGNLLELFPGQFRSLWWKNLDKELKESPRLMAGEQLTEPFLAQEHGAKYWIDFQAGYSQGIFLDQRLNRQEVRKRSAPGQRVLNTFAYTCPFSVVAALGGATATSLDLSRPYLEWGKRNFSANGLDPEAHHFVRGDVFEWLRQFGKKGRTFHGVVLDPPTFSRNQKGKVFQVKQDYAALVELAARLLEPGGWLLCCTNHFSLTRKRFGLMIDEGLRAAGVKAQKRRFASMPPEFEPEDYLKSCWVDVA